MRKRKEAEEYILKYIGKIVKGGDDNVKLYQNLFKSMSDKAVSYTHLTLPTMAVV